MNLAGRDLGDEIYGEVENALDGAQVKFENKEWEDTEGQILERVQKMFLDEIEKIYDGANRGIEEAFDDGKIDETFRDTFLEYINNRNSKHWDSTMFY